MGIISRDERVRQKTQNPEAVSRKKKLRHLREAEWFSVCKAQKERF